MNLKDLNKFKSKTVEATAKKKPSSVAKDTKYFIVVKGTKTLQVYNGTFLPYDKAVAILDVLKKESIEAYLYPFTNVEDHIFKYEELVNSLENEISNLTRKCASK